MVFMWIQSFISDMKGSWKSLEILYDEGLWFIKMTAVV